MYKTQVISALCSEKAKRWSTRPHSHTFFHLFFVCKGKVIFRSGDNEHHLTRGGLIIFPPNVEHSISRNNYTPSDMCEIKFDILDKNLRKLWDNNSVFLASHVSHLESIIRYITYHWCVNGAYTSDSIDAFLTTILFSLISSNTGFRSIYTDISNYTDITKRIISYIENNYMKAYSLEQLSAEMHYNKNYVCTAFREDTGISISHYYNYVRMRRILVSLYYLDTTGSVTINMLSNYVGFRDYSYFCRVFKRMTGLTPSEYVNALSAKDSDGRNYLSKYSEKNLCIKVLPLKQGLEYMKGLKEASLKN